MAAPDWPNHPATAVRTGDHWQVKGVPPDPWPSTNADYSDVSRFGPPLTVWVFTADDLVDAQTHLPGSAFLLKQLMSDVLAKLCVRAPSSQALAWVTPLSGENAGETEFYTMRWFRVTVHGKLGTTEEVAHTFAMRTQPNPDVDQTIAQVAALAAAVRDSWAHFITTVHAPLGSAPQSLLSAALTYDEVRVAYLEQTAAATRDPNGRYIYPRPAYLVATQYAAFTAGLTGMTGTPELPWEVAAVMTLNTNVRGASFRGRTYLGPFGAALMGTRNGLFVPATIAGLGSAFGTNFIDRLNTTSGAQFQIVSRTHLHAAPVQGVRVGQVPDSQRRRRRGQPEAYVQAWGQAIGAVPPA